MCEVKDTRRHHQVLEYSYSAGLFCSKLLSVRVVVCRRPNDFLGAAGELSIEEQKKASSLSIFGSTCFFYIRMKAVIVVGFFLTLDVKILCSSSEA